MAELSKGPLQSELEDLDGVSAKTISDNPGPNSFKIVTLINVEVFGIRPFSSPNRVFVDSVRKD